ncbi:MAG: hypothetical protein M0D57_06740 [Sphingobacteriales bacterium JAD_PAG50586_3]|nr:MAG: hypothetical protein M0D57_06740 [Sphingobacteriales bacterium JAD_PAG50586_3]
MTGKSLIMAVLLLMAVPLNAQVAKDIPADNRLTGFKQKGYLTMGIRNTFSTFNGGGNYTGYGVGGHFRVPIIPRINTEWYADYITNNIGGMGHRTDYHIGWSVMYYLINPSVAQAASGDPIVRLRKFNPFVEAGHCFDYGGIYRNGDLKPSVERWSSAVQFGAGTHYNITPALTLP